MALTAEVQRVSWQAFVEKLDVELQRSRRYKRDFAVCLVKLDMPLAATGERGVPSEKIRQELARIVASCLRTVDILMGYLSDDEYAVILPETPGPNAVIAAERIRRSVAEYNFLVDETTGQQLTVSVGLSAFPRHAHTPALLADRAREAVQFSAGRGGNCVSTATEGNISAPGWCFEASFEELDVLKGELVIIESEISGIVQRTNEVRGKLELLESLKNDLLYGLGDALERACCQVFERLGLSVRGVRGPSGEMWMNGAGGSHAFVSIIRTVRQPSPSDLVTLAESTVSYWGKEEVEPKAILVANSWAETAPDDRTEPDFAESTVDFAMSNAICLLSTSQLLRLFVDVSFNGLEPAPIVESLLNTKGKFELSTPAKPRRRPRRGS